MNAPDRKELRKRIKSLRESLSNEAREEAGKRASDLALTLPELGEAETVALYMTNRGELPTEFLIDRLLSMGKRVVLPRVDPLVKGKMTFRARFKGPVRLCGTSVQYATLHNMDYIENLGIDEGCRAVCRKQESFR